MIDTKDFALADNFSKFNIKGLINRIIGHWKWFLVCWLIAFTIAYQINIRKEKIYALDTTIAVKEENNPFFTSNTSLVFNWGGTSDQVNNIMTTLRSRTHNEMVVDKLEYYVNYLKQGKYHLNDVYGQAPFYFVLNKNKPQVANQLISITFAGADTFVVEKSFENNTANAIYYNNHEVSSVNVEPKNYKIKYRVGQSIELPFLNGLIFLHPDKKVDIGSTYFIKFSHLDGVVSSYRNIKVDSDPKAGSIIRLSLSGKNKARIVDYLNATVDMLIKRQLDRKNQFANNTINFIDSTLIAIDASIKDSEKDIKDFSKNKNVLEIESSGANLSNKILQYENERDFAKRKLAYYNNLNSYLNSSSTDFTKLPTPTVVGIEDPNIVGNVSRLISLTNEKTELQYTRKNKLLFDELDNEMLSLKKTIQENIKSASANVKYDLNLANSKINEFEFSMRALPIDQQEYLKITRKYQLNDNIYASFLAKRNEAEIVKAANLADIHFIDPAKDIGGGLIGPDTKINYILALIFGFLIPLVIIFLIFFFDTSILKIDDITAITKVPIIGVVGSKNTDSNLSVFEKPKSALAETFRAIRSSLQFLYRKGDNTDGKIMMLTSSISGEGKTFCSINLATIYALNNKKTILVGLDLRKPKIFGDFNINNNIGAVNYIIGEKKLSEVIQNSHIENLDVITSGPIPPNPSELLMSEYLVKMIEELKKSYDYIILDTPPIGLVSDALSLSSIADVNLFVIRQRVTKKEMISMINNRVKREELKNVSIIFNGFESKAKYGYGYGNYSGYGYGYGYGYGSKGYGYHEEEKTQRWYQKILNKFK